MKKILSVILAVLMIVTVMPLSVFAENETISKDNSEIDVFSNNSFFNDSSDTEQLVCNNVEMYKYDGYYYIIDESGLYRYSLDFSDKKLLLSDVGSAKFSIYKNVIYVYYKSLIAYDINTETSKVLTTMNYSDAFFSGNNIYFEKRVTSDNKSFYQIVEYNLITNYEKVVYSSLSYDLTIHAAKNNFLFFSDKDSNDKNNFVIDIYRYDANTEDVISTELTMPSDYSSYSWSSFQINDLLITDTNIYITAGSTEGSGLFYTGDVYISDYYSFSFERMAGSYGRTGCNLYYFNDKVYVTKSYDKYSQDFGLLAIDNLSTNLCAKSILANYGSCFLYLENENLYLFDAATNTSKIVIDGSEYKDLFNEYKENAKKENSNLKDSYFKIQYYEVFFDGQTIAYYPALIIPPGVYTNAGYVIHKSGIEFVSLKRDSMAITLFSTEKSLQVKKGEHISLGFGLFDIEKGDFDGDWKKMALTVSDPTIISLSDYKTNKYGYSIDVTGKKEGSTTVTITDAESGTNTTIVITVTHPYDKPYSYDIENISTFYPENMWENHIKTNIYNLNGLFVNNYNYTKSGNKYTVSFDVYNQQHHTAAVDIYNAQGEWIDCEPIEKFSNSTNVWEVGEQLFYLISDVSTLTFTDNESKFLTYMQSASAKHTPIEIEVPEGGYFTISNNFAESPGTFLFNAAEMLFNGACTLIDLFTTNDIKISEFSGLLKETIVKNESKRKKFFELFTDAAKSEIKTYAQNMIQGSIDDAYSGIAGLLENMLNSLDLKWKHLFKSVTGIGESALELLGGPAGIALKGCFEISDSINQLLQATSIGFSLNEPHATIYSVIDKEAIKPHGIAVKPDGNLDVESVLQVFRVSDTDNIEIILNSDNPFEIHELYNICFVKNDQLVQPNGKVKVQIPVPTGMKGDTCKIYRQEPDNSWTILNAHVEGNYLVFETDHFSIYAVVGDVAGLSIHSLPDKINYLQDDILDTQGLVLNLNGELITDGYLCNPTVMSGCGLQTITVTYGHATTQFDVYTHTPGKWEVITPAQVGIEGLEQCKCTVCGEVLDERVIPALGDSVTFTLGDVNGDGKVNASDARLALRISAQLDTPTQEQFLAADVNSDSRITASDARIILRVSAQLETL